MQNTAPRPFRSVVSNGTDVRTVEGAARSAQEFEDSFTGQLADTEWVVTTVETA